MLTKLFTKAPIVLLALNFIACSLFTPAAIPATVDIDKEEQAIYSFFINDDGIALILQETSSNVSEDDPKESVEFIKSGFKKISKETINSFLDRNAHPGLLSPDMQLGTDYILITADDLQTITIQPNWGELLTEEYKGAHGYTIFSRVGFNNSLDQAVVYVGQVAGPLMGSGSYYLMEKQNGEWKLMEQIMAWIS